MAKTLDRFEAEQSEIVQRLEAQLKEKDQILEGWKKDQGDLEVQLRAVTNHVMAIHPKPIVYSPKENVEWTEVVPVMQFTDWHIGERQMADEIEGINEYDYSVATKRVSDLVHRENRVIDRTRHSYKIKRCVVIETGDMISGDIHEELSRTNEFPVPMQVVKAAELFAQGVSALAQNFDHVKVEYLTADNHSRLTKKPQAKQQGVNSFNFLVGVIAEKLLSKHPNVEFEIHTEPQKVIPVLARRYLTIHGHQIRGWAGVPWYGVERKVGKESTSRLSMIMEDPQRLERLGYHKIVAGHLHVPINSMYYSVGGSLSGTNSYDRDNGRYAPPSQPMWFVHPKYGEFGRIDFTL